MTLHWCRVKDRCTRLHGAESSRHMAQHLWRGQKGKTWSYERGRVDAVLTAVCEGDLRQGARNAKRRCQVLNVGSAVRYFWGGRWTVDMVDGAGRHCYSKRAYEGQRWRGRRRGATAVGWLFASQA